jgi:tetratricopeptide (TPR) repeat protein
MAMHEIETLVEMSVYSLDKSAPSSPDCRSLFYNLYCLQEQFDAGFTHFRVMDLLIKHRFVYTMPITAHPAYAKNKAYFDQLAAAQKFSFIYEYPQKKWDSDTNPVAGYANYDQAQGTYLLYADAGSILWKSLVDAKKLQGADARPPLVIPVTTLAHIVAKAAAAQKDTALLSMWYQLLPYIIMQEDEEDDMLANKDLKAVLDLVVKNNAIDATGLPPIDELPEGGSFGDFCQWWYAPALPLMQATAQEEEEINLDEIPFTETVEKSATWYEREVAKILQAVNEAIAHMEDHGADEATQTNIDEQLKLALEYAAQGLTLAPDNTGLIVNQGTAWMLLQQYEQALACYDAALATAPDNAFVHLNRAILFFHMDQFAQAAAAFKQTLALEPENEFARQWLQYLENEKPL